jgi:hypothetical protein
MNRSSTGTLPEASATALITLFAPANFTAFMSGHTALSGASLTSAADPDNDGLSNLLEYAFGSSPIQSQRHADVSSMSTTNGSNRDLTLVHRRSKSAAVTFSYESSANLTTWSPASPAVTVIQADADGDNLTEIVSAVLSTPSTEPRQFLRVKATAP